MMQDMNLFAPTERPKETEEARIELEALQIEAKRVSRTIEQELLRVVRTGRFGFEDLGRIAMSIMSQIAQSAVRNGLDTILGGKPGGNGLGGIVATIFGSLGLPGRMTGGPVGPGQAYLVGERGPEIFLPTNSGQILPGAGA
ncbi:hypothetical protein [Sphingobium nicotianae]|uniref:Tail tape measure protein n=1 Tax=Sphingobium nicotianae TaxID=2782607 RepID=A0A9X1DBI2_9SPHN|nr:hypothetical protein [Sphingobium nicotianae]MBT2186861.1 hypothetical protein [Sphingobium nicotianae]